MTTMSKVMDLYIEPEMLDYIDFINDNALMGANILTPQKINHHFDEVGEYLNNLMVYPDILVDIMTPIDSHFKLFFYQRLILRSNVRHLQVFTVATRGASKTFLGMLSRFLTAMEIPGHRSFVCADIKRQAIEITKQTINDDIWVKFPLLAQEMSLKIMQPGKRPKDPYILNADSAEYYFSGGGQFDVISVDSARGKRRHSGQIEEVIEQDALKLNEKVLPLLNISRRTKLGELSESELHGVKLYITTAGYQGAFAYDKFIETLCLAAIDPQHYMVLSFSYKIPLMHGLLNYEIIKDLRSSPSYDEASFDREYRSRWSGAMKGAAFSYDIMKKMRKVVRAETRSSPTLADNEFYTIGVDMAKDGSAKTVAVVLKVYKGPIHFIYKQVNGFIIDTSDYQKVANELKKTVFNYDAKLMTIDATGVGASIRDWLNKDTFDEDGHMLPGLGIMNPPKDSAKDLIKRPMDRTLVYELKIGNNVSEINKLFFGRIGSGAIKMLITFREALDRYKTIGKFCTASVRKQREVLQPYQFADRIAEEFLNLDVKEISDSGTPGLRVIRRNNQIQKDCFSAFSYAVYGVHLNFELAHYKARNSKRRSRRDYIRLTEIDDKRGKYGRQR